MLIGENMVSEALKQCYLYKLVAFKEMLIV